MHFGPNFIRLAVIMLGLSLAGGVWRAFWTSGTGVRTMGSLQRLNRRVFGAPPPEPVELGPDGRWRPYVTPKTKRAERWAGMALWGIAGFFILLFIIDGLAGQH